MTDRPLTPREIQCLGPQLVYAAERGETDEAIRLLREGADARARGENGLSALDWAARRGDLRLLDELLRPGLRVDPDVATETTPLQWAVREGRDAAAERLISAGADVRRTDAKGHTVLHFAAARGNRSMVERLLLRGADRDAVDSFDDTPLTLAAAGAHFDIARILVDKGANINAQGNGGRTAFLQAVMENRIPAGDEKIRLLEALISRHADPEIADDYCWTPLMRAAHAGDEPVVRFLLEHGANVSRADGQGLTPLHWAAQAGHQNIIHLLFTRGAEVDAKDNQGQTALFRQMRDPNPETVKFLLNANADPNARNKRGDTVLMAAVRKQNIEMAALLLEHGADLHAKGMNDETPLDAAVNGGMDDMAHFLQTRGSTPSRPLAESLNLGGDIDAPDDRGWTPLGKAARDNDVGRIHLLLDAGAKIDAADSRGVTPLMIAAERSSAETLAALLERGADRLARDAEGMSVLHHLVAGQRIEHVPVLLAGGAEVDARDNRGRTPLMAAIAQYDNAISELLLGAGADVNLRNEQGRTALMVAVSSRNLEVVDRLLAAGADDSVEDNDERTALDIALELNEPELAAKLGYVAPVREPEPLQPSSAPFLQPSDKQWPVPETVLERLAEMFPDETGNESEPAADEADTDYEPIAEETLFELVPITLPVPPPMLVPPKLSVPMTAVPPFTRHSPGFMLDADREVDCACDVRFHRPVYRDHTGINFRVTACLRCGTLSVTESMVDEPRPHDVRCVGNVIQEVAPDAHAWLDSWPRLAWGVWNDDRSIYLPASLRVSTIEELSEFERASLGAQRALPMRERLEAIGFPAKPAPATLPEQLKSFRETWEGLQLSETDNLDTLLRSADDRTYASQFSHAILLKRPNIANEIAFMLRSNDPVRFRAAKSLVDRHRLSDPEIVAAVLTLLRSAPLTETALHPLLDTLYYIGPAAAEARPILQELADRIGERRNYYLHKRIMEVRELINATPDVPA